MKISEEDVELEQTLTSPEYTSVPQYPAQQPEMVHQSALPPDGGWGWVIVVASCLSHVFCSGLGRCVGVVFVPLRQKYDASATAVSWIFSIYNTLSQIGAPLVSVLVERFGCRPIVIIGSVVTSVGFLTSGFAPTLFLFYVTHSVIAGVGTSLIYSPIYIVIGEYFHKKRGKAMGLSTVGGGIGSLALAPLVQVANTAYGITGAMVSMAALVLQCAVCGTLFRPVSRYKTLQTIELQTIKEHSNVQKQNNESCLDEKHSEAVDKSLEKQRVSPGCTTGVQNNSEHTKSFHHFSNTINTNARVLLLRNKTFLVYLSNIFAVPHIMQTVTLYMPPLGIEQGSNPTQAALLVSAGGLADIVGRIVFGFVFDWTFLRRRCSILHSMMGICIGVVVILHGLTSTYTGLLVLSLSWGFLVGGFHGQRMTILSEFVEPQLHTFAIGCAIFTQGLGNFTAPLMAGILADNYNTYRVPFFYFGTMVLATSLTFAVTYIIMRYRTRRAERVHHF